MVNEPRVVLDSHSERTVNAAIINLSAEALIEALHLPKDTEIVGCRMDPLVPGVVNITVKHPDLRPVQGGCQLPTIAPTLRYVRPDVPPIVQFDGWGQ